MNDTSELFIDNRNLLEQVSQTMNSSGEALDKSDVISIKAKRGRKNHLTVEMILSLYSSKGKKTIKEIAEFFGISIRTVERKHSLITREQENEALNRHDQVVAEKEAELKKAFVDDLIQCSEFNLFVDRIKAEIAERTQKTYIHKIYLTAATIANNGVWTHKRDAKLFKRPSMWTIEEVRKAIIAAPKASKFNLAVAIRAIRQDLKLPDVNGQLVKTKKLKEGIKSHVSSEDYFSFDEMQRILEAAKGFGIKVESVIQYGYHCATRVSGTARARWRDVTWNNPIYKRTKEAYIDFTKNPPELAWKENQMLVSTAQILVKEKTTITFNKLLTPYLADLLKQLHAQNPTSEFIWLNDQGTHHVSNRWLNDILRAVSTKAGVSRSFPIHWHMLRHTFATHSRKRGVPSQLAIRQGGWEHADTFDQKYVSVITEELAEAILL